MAYVPKPITQLKMQFWQEMEKEESCIECKKCGSQKSKLYGRTNAGNQRYMCLACGRTFVRRTNKADDTSRKPVEVWDLFLECMMDCKSVRVSAAICEISCDTAFRWRQKILDCVWNMAKDGSLPFLIPHKEQSEESWDPEVAEAVQNDPSLLGWLKEEEEMLNTDQTPLAPTARVDVERWVGVSGKNVRKYQIWQRFVREAKRSGKEKAVLAKNTLKRPTV